MHKDRQCEVVQLLLKRNGTDNSHLSRKYAYYKLKGANAAEYASLLIWIIFNLFQSVKFHDIQHLQFGYNCA